MADDAGALLVRSGLVSSSALDDARSQVAELGGTLGEQLVTSGLVGDDELTEFYKQRLLVPQVNPNTLARLPAKVVAVIPSDMAIELRAIPVSLDNDNNLTVAMSDPSDRHAVDEISFFTGAYVVRAVATQMQIAWCLAHYYGHVTHLGKRLLQPDVELPPERFQSNRKRPRGMTGEVDAMRHRGIVPGQATVSPIQPTAAVPAADDELTIPVAPLAVGRDTEEQPLIPEPANGDDAKSPRARSISGEIRVVHRAPSIKPPLPDDDSGPVIVMELDNDPSGPSITIEADEPSEAETRSKSEDDTDRSKAVPPRRRRPAEPDPPELAARAGEVDLKSTADRDVSGGPSIVVEDELEREGVPEAIAGGKTVPVSPSIEVSGELVARDRQDGPSQSNISVEISDEDSAAVMIHDGARTPDAAPRAVQDEPSAPILLDRKRPSEPPPPPIGVVELPKKPIFTPVQKPSRADRRTVLGLAVAGQRTHRDTEVGVPTQLDDDPTGQRSIDVDPTRVDGLAIAPGEDTGSDETLAAPPSPVHGDDTSPLAAPPRPGSVPPPSGQIRLTNVKPAARGPDVGDDEDDRVHGKATMVMTAVELDEVIPGRSIEYDPVDDGWGPPGTTIPPPLLGAIPGAVERFSGVIPLPNLDSQPLMVAPPSPPEHTRPHTNTEAGIARALEQATSRVLDLIHELERAVERNDVVNTMIGHLAETHRRAGFFAARGGELSLFSITPAVVGMSAATLRLDRPSTLQDVVGTRLPYRGPMHDPDSRMFLQSVLGVCPPEILLVPITVRERVVGVLFGEHRMRHTFDDQLALAGRAAGMALERILKAKRG